MKEWKLGKNNRLIIFWRSQFLILLIVISHPKKTSLIIVRLLRTEILHSSRAIFWRGFFAVFFSVGLSSTPLLLTGTSEIMKGKLYEDGMLHKERNFAVYTVALFLLWWWVHVRRTRDSFVVFDALESLLDPETIRKSTWDSSRSAASKKRKRVDDDEMWNVNATKEMSRCEIDIKTSINKNVILMKFDSHTWLVLLFVLKGEKNTLSTFFRVSCAPLFSCFHRQLSNLLSVMFHLARTTNNKTVHVSSKQLEEKRSTGKKKAHMETKNFLRRFLLKKSLRSIKWWKKWTKAGEELHGAWKSDVVSSRRLELFDMFH